jgi:hypothetical protein
MPSCHAHLFTDSVFLLGYCLTMRYCYCSRISVCEVRRIFLCETTSWVITNPFWNHDVEIIQLRK